MIQNNPVIKKVRGSQVGCGSQEMTVMGTKFTKIVIKIFAFSLSSQQFLGHHLGFHIFFHSSLLKNRILFYSWASAVWIRFVTAICEAGIKCLFYSLHRQQFLIVLAMYMNNMFI